MSKIFTSHKLFLLLFMISSYSSAQYETTHLDINNIDATINTRGLLFHDIETSLPGFEAPSGTDLHTIYASHLWIGGKKLDGTLCLAADKYGTNGNEFYQGPLSADGLATTNSDQMLFYSRFWEANSSELQTHIDYYNAVLNGTDDVLFPNGYTIPSWILDWPAHGDVDLDQAFNLAPYVDVNQNLMYDPVNGDYPRFPGDVCIYYIMNDKGGIHNNSGGQAMGLEIHVMVYAFITSDALNDAIFVSYRIVNRSSQTYLDCYVGNWTDLDIGSPIDDYIGCDVANGFYYGYNGDDYDEPTSSSDGYGTQTPLQAIVFLGGPSLEADGIDNQLPSNLSSYETYGEYGPGYGDGVIDNERLGMTSFMYYNNSTNPTTGEPNTAQQYYNLMSGIWLNGASLLYGGNGAMGGGVTTEVTKYAFPGDSDPANYATGGTEMDEWSEATAGNLPGDRRGLATSGPFILEPGEVVDLDLCFLHANEGISGIDELTYAQNLVSQLRGYYHDELVDRYKLEVYTDVQETTQNFSFVDVYPNPCLDHIQIQSKNNELLHIEIFDGTGRKMDEQNVKHTLRYSMENLPRGIYTFMITADGNKMSTRVIKE